MNRVIKYRLHDKEGIVIGYEEHKKNEFGCYQIYQTSLREDWNDGTETGNVREGYFIAASYKFQFTGLLDKNGKEVYEGDICELINEVEFKSSTSMSGIRTVVWDSSECKHEFSGCVPLVWGGHESIEIIGNIHENPELLQ